MPWQEVSAMSLRHEFVTLKGTVTRPFIASEGLRSASLTGAMEAGSRHCQSV